MTIPAKRTTVIVLIVLAALFATAWWAYSTYVSPTRIAVVSFPGFMIEKMERANTNSWVRIEHLELEDLDKLDTYPFALIRGHGIRISAEQLDRIRNASEKGTKIYIADVTNPEYDLSVTKDRKIFEAFSTTSATRLNARGRFSNPTRIRLSFPEIFFFISRKI